MPKDAPKRRCPDTGKMEKLLGWKPEVGPKQGLKITIEWFNKRLKKQPEKIFFFSLIMIGLFHVGLLFYGLLGVEFDFDCDIVEFLVGGV